MTTADAGSNVGTVDSMLERVKAAIRAEYFKAEKDLEGDEFGRYARAAVEAMREPPPHIVQAGTNVSMEIDGNQLFHAWQAMIDAALKGP